MIVSNRSPISYIHVLCIWRKLQESLPKSIEKWLNSAWACQGIAKLERIQSLAIKSVKTSREPPFLPSTHCWVESKNHQLNYPSLMLRWPRWNWYVTILGSEIYNDDVLTFTCYVPLYDRRAITVIWPFSLSHVTILGSESYNDDMTTFTFTCDHHMIGEI